ncbi:hypothetical protein [Haloplanus salilacus]|uniref:hypothetical protein n=1 Tax=Haloplanus salilacus TaxID=2949994 RepID=UPI0030CEBF48
MIGPSLGTVRDDGRAQSELIGVVLVVGLVVVGVSAVGLVVVTSQEERAAAQKAPVDVAGDVGDGWATATHRGGPGVPRSDLALVLESGGSERRYTFDDPAVTLTGDGDDVFEGGESVNVSHSYEGTVRLRVIETSEPTRLLYEETFDLGGDGAVDDGPTIQRFDVNDTSSDGNASFDVTWRATDPTGDLTDVDVELVDQGTGTVEDSESYTYGGTGDTGTETFTLRNVSGVGNVYVLRITAEDAAGNVASDVRVRAVGGGGGGGSPPVVESLVVTDTTTGQDASFDATYNATDVDGDLTEVRVELIEDDSGTVVDSVIDDDYNETNATGEQTRSLSAPGKNKGTTYRIEVTAVDANGGTDTEDVTISAGSGEEGSGGASGPTVTGFDVSDESFGKTASYNVSWAVEDADGTLDSVTVRLVETGKNNPDAEEIYDVTGQSSASDTVTLEPNGNRYGTEYRIELVVTDADGLTASESWTDTADGTGSN